MMALEDYSAIEETIYLLRSPKKAQSFYKALEQLKSGQYQKRELIEELDLSPLNHPKLGDLKPINTLFPPELGG